MEKKEIEINTLTQNIFTVFWRLQTGTGNSSDWSVFENDIITLYKLNRYRGRKSYSRLLSRQNNKTDTGNAVTDWLLKISDQIPDTMTHRIVSRSTVIRGTLKSLSQLTSIRTNVPVDLTDKKTIAPEHIKCLKNIILHMGMHDINCDFRSNKNLIYLASIDKDLAKTLEDHMLKKARRYKNFYNLVGYLENFPNADKRKFFVEIFKHKTHYKARVAIDRLKKHPELHKYFNLT